MSKELSETRPKVRLVRVSSTRPVTPVFDGTSVQVTCKKLEVE